jgi:phosphotransferase system enzyme I (PtsI)
MSSGDPERKSVSEKRIKGVASSPGLNLGTAFVINLRSYNKHFTTPKKIDKKNELDRYERAKIQALNEIELSITLVEKNQEYEHNVISILETYRMILLDSSLNATINEKINANFLAENAIIDVFEENKKVFQQAKDRVLRERTADLDHIQNQLISFLQEQISIENIPENAVVIASAISPTEVMLLSEASVSAILTEVGGIASHTSILARSLRIPSVIGLKGLLKSIKSGAQVLVDGYSGIVYVNPKTETITKFSEQQKKETSYKIKLQKIAKLPALTKDLHKVKVKANINTLEDVDEAMMAGAEGIGLVRSESLVIALNRYPTEEEQYKWYLEISERAYPKSVTIRAFDVGFDKFTKGIVYQQPNPALGIRGIRFLQRNEHIFKTQIRAILRASCHRNIKLLIPMVSRIEEVLYSLKIIDQAKHSLRKDNLEFDPYTPIGIMIETPSAALIADKLSQYVDFISIGTNDLTQYTLAADRNNDLVSDIFDYFDPSVLQLIKLTINGAKINSIPVSICGEFAGHSAATELLVGMGVDELSVTSQNVLELKRRIRRITLINSETLAKEVLQSLSAKEVRKKISVIKRSSKK